MAEYSTGDTEQAERTEPTEQAPANEQQDASQSPSSAAEETGKTGDSGAASSDDMAAKTGDGGPDEPLVTPGMNWFVLRVASNKEHSVQRTILRKVKIEGFEHIVNRIVVPTEKQKTIKGGKQRVVEEKLYPGYVFVEMASDQ
jgi:transcriptional antiterminator NusG